MLHDFINIFDFNWFESFTSCHVFDIIRTEEHAWIEIFVDKKEIHIDVWKDSIIVCKFCYE